MTDPSSKLARSSAGPLTGLLARAARRVRLLRAYRGTALGLIGGGAASFALIAIDRWFALELTLNVLLLPAALGAAFGAVAGAIRPVAPRELAIAIDQRFALADRLATAREIEEEFERGAGGHIDPDFADLIRRDAEHAARGLHPRDAFPAAFSGRDAGVLVGLALLTAAAVWLPARTPAPRGPEAPTVSWRASDEAAAAAIGDQMAQMREALMPDAGGDDDLESDAVEDTSLALLEAIAEQLTRPAAPEERDRQRQTAAAELSDLAERLEQEAALADEALRQLAEDFRGIDQRTLPPRIEALREQLARGDFERAAATLDDLLNHMREDDELEPAEEEFPQTENEEAAQREREEDAAALDRMREALEEAAAERARRAEEERERLAEALRRAGLDDEAVREMLGDANGDDAPADTPESADATDAGDVQESADDTSGNGEESTDTAPEASEETATEPRQRPEISERLQEAVERFQREERVRREESERRRELSEALREASESLCEGGACEEGGDSPQDGEDAQSAAASEERDASSSSCDGGDCGTPGGAVRRMGERQEQAAQRRQLAEQARRAAQELVARSEDPEPSAPPSRAERTPPREGDAPRHEPGSAGAPTDRRTARDRFEPDAFDDVDLSRDAEAERLLAEWFDPERRTEIGDARTARTLPPAVAERARRAADQAIEDADVPPRYHELLRRYFARLGERAADPAPDASTEREGDRE